MPYPKEIPTYLCWIENYSDLFLKYIFSFLAHEEGISDQDQDDHDDDNSPNDYETVFVKTDHEARFEVMDQVLSQRMALSQKPMMGTAMLQSSISSKSSSPLSSMLSNLDSLDRPPQPPPKQRHLIGEK